jgi:hypothetical protein
MTSLLPFVSLIAIAAFLIFLFSELREQVAKDLAEKRRKARLALLQGKWIDQSGFQPHMEIGPRVLTYPELDWPNEYAYELLKDTLVIYTTRAIQRSRIVSIDTHLLILETDGEEAIYTRNSKQ